MNVRNRAEVVLAPFALLAVLAGFYFLMLAAAMAMTAIALLAVQAWEWMLT